MDFIGKKIGKYKVLNLIGEGGMASVYKGQHETLGTEVAIKILNPVFAANEAIRKRFKDEAMLLATLNHPNISRVEDYDEEHMAIVMELLKGQNLKEYCIEKKQINESEIIHFLKQVLKAFQFAHENGVIHRDIKPANIFILPNRQIKILDFGIAKLFGEGKHNTQTGISLGTPTFMSPEQVKADKTIDHRSDIFSLGLTVYTMAEGNLPYDSDELSLYEVFKCILEQQLPTVQSSVFLNDIIIKACAKNRENRFQSCEEWLNEIYAYEKINQQIKSENVKNSEVNKVRKSTPKKSSIVIITAISTLTVIIAFTIYKAISSKSKEATVNATGTEKVLIELGQERDQQGSTFTTVKIESQIWMAQNLNVNRFINGDIIMEAKSINDWIFCERNKIPAWCYYDNEIENGKFYGRLYNWYAINDSRGLAPSGWHIPTSAEWEVLANRKEGNIGNKLKANNMWEISKSEEKGTNEFSFNALPGGYRSPLGLFKDVASSGYWWCSNQTGSDKAWSIYLTSQGNHVTLNSEWKNQGCAVRCIKN